MRNQDQALLPEVSVLVIGAGTMGSGIAHVAARAGHRVFLFDQQSEALKKGMASIATDMQFLVRKGKIRESEAQALLARVCPISEIHEAAGVGIAIEAIVEQLDIKQKLLIHLEAHLSASAILASNTSSLSITALAAGCQRPERVAGLHFFNPAPRMALVEIVRGLATSTETLNTLYATAKAWGKLPVDTHSTPGFIVNRVARPYYAEALRLLNEQAASVATIDVVLREACGFPMGPFALMDMIGHDVNFAVTCSVFESSFGDRRYTPSLIQQELVWAGRLGRKCGQGFYDYQENATPLRPNDFPIQSPPSQSQHITAIGALGLLEPLLARFSQSGIACSHDASDCASGFFQIEQAIFALSDGRTASKRAHDEGREHLVLVDWALDFATAPRLALTKADSCSESALFAVVAALQALGIKVCVVEDVAGLIGLRTIAMIANEAADAVLQGVCSVEDVNLAMKHGTHYPKGPLAWAEDIGYGDVVEALDHLWMHYAEERYRVSPWLRRQALRKC